jgi:hypothetical protein
VTTPGTGTAPVPGHDSGAGASACDDTVTWAEFRAWERQLATTGTCSHPIRLTGRIEAIDRATGETAPVYDTASEAGGVLHVACGNRREIVCPACSAVYKRDARQLVRAGLVGKGVSARKNWDPADRSFRRTARAASADSEVRPGPRLPTLRPHQSRSGKPGRSTTHTLPAESGPPVDARFAAGAVRRTGSSSAVVVGTRCIGRSACLRQYPAGRYGESSAGRVCGMPGSGPGSRPEAATSSRTR